MAGVPAMSEMAGIGGMGAVALIGLLAGLDNLQVGAALGCAGMRRGRRWGFALVSGLCETLMPLLGLALGRQMQHAIAVRFGAAAGPQGGPGVAALIALVVGGCGGAILFQALRDGDAAAIADSRFAVFGLPVTLSFDNLFAGIGLGSLGYPVLLSAAVVGAVSSGLCLIGLFGGALVRGWSPRWAPVASGLCLVALAVARLLGFEA